MGGLLVVLVLRLKASGQIFGGGLWATFVLLCLSVHMKQGNTEERGVTWWAR